MFCILSLRCFKSEGPSLRRDPAKTGGRRLQSTRSGDSPPRPEVVRAGASAPTRFGAAGVVGANRTGLGDQSVGGAVTRAKRHGAMCGTWRSSRDRGTINPESRLGVAVPFTLAAMRPCRRGCSTGVDGRVRDLRSSVSAKAEARRSGAGKGKCWSRCFTTQGTGRATTAAKGSSTGGPPAGACGQTGGDDHDHYRRHLRTGAREAGEAAAFPSIGLPPGCRSGNGARDGGIGPARRPRSCRAI